MEARLAKPREASEAEPHDSEAIKAVCVCYLDPTNSARAPYLLKRINRRIPDAMPIAAVFGSESAPHLGDDYRVVTTLDGAVQAIVSALAAEDDAAKDRPIERAKDALERVKSRTEPV